MVRELYQKKENRDRRARDLVATYGKANVIRSSVRGQLLHPMYVRDFQGPEKENTGLGNTVYKTYFAILYKVEVVAVGSIWARELI